MTEHNATEIAYRNGYVVTKNGEDFLHTSTQISAADIVERLMADARDDCDRRGEKQ